MELGAGLGVVGLTAAKLGAQVVVTDLAAVLPGLQQNIQVWHRSCSRDPPLDGSNR